ncbi:aminoglycoside phosphotransferase family protein [Gallaecimonas xiamenensis]|uniref:Aminoglycoside phosphotransferase n=1 Tax=Gallaecimonas xiamenensis 3-C-1 TaxID=745411 RepID=K2KEK6_9GAMM|nr:phosphotransferase [Gallaecimonas xiamenensis]EKE75735.1 aminoglycoside phosphotransferase [Gallaecimonas xiamenensis 3-C-1]
MRDNTVEALKIWAGEHLGQPDLTFSPLAGDAGSRRYWRITHPGGTVIAVLYPDSETSQADRFVSCATWLAGQGIKVPLPLARQGNWMLLPDLGERLLSGLAADQRPAWYAKAIALLGKLQGLDVPLDRAGQPFVQRKQDLFQQWYLKRHLGVALAPGQLDGIFQLLFNNFFEQPAVPAHRDYHGRNLHCVGDQLAVIDFQDLQLLPLTYDAVSLIRDSYVALSPAEEQALIQQGFAQQAHTGDLAQYRRWLDLTGVLRQLKVLGIFCRLHYQDGKSGYLKDLAPTRDKLLRVARQYEELAPLVALLDEHQ